MSESSKSIRIEQLSTYEACEINDFTTLLHARQPFVLRNLNLGDCLLKWRDTQYLSLSGGCERCVSVHKTFHNCMNFVHKNFSYENIQFGEFITKASNDVQGSSAEKLYLRSISSDKRKIAMLEDDYPRLSRDFIVPDWLPEIHSSVLRISSSQLQIWTHYDTLDNMLFQVVGTKNVCLFNPADIDCMYLNGDKSLVCDVDRPDLDQFPLFASAVQYRSTLNEGDAVFIPSFWFHAMRALTFSVGVNIFWRNLDPLFYDNGDVYGNRDLMPAQRANQSMQNICKALQQLPPDVARFYARKLAHELRAKFEIN